MPFSLGTSTWFRKARRTRNVGHHQDRRGGATLARKPWKAPRLIDLDEDDSEGMTGQFIMNTNAANKRFRATEQSVDLGDIVLFNGPS